MLTKIGVTTKGALQMDLAGGLDPFCCSAYPIAPGGTGNAAIPRISVAQADTLADTDISAISNVYTQLGVDGTSMTISWEFVRFFGSQTDFVNAQVTLFKNGNVFFCWGEGNLESNSFAAGLEDDGFSLAYPVPLPGFDSQGITDTFPSNQCACFYPDPEVFANTFCPVDSFKNHGQYNG
ncbi:MAG: hypothetical protein SGARI_003857, partial [Bacillariaceae sp.]